MRLSESPAVPTEGGYTLLEVVITVALLSIAFVGILTALSGLVASGVENRNAATVQATVRGVAAFTQSASSTTYVACDQTRPNVIAAYQSAIAAAYPSATITDVQFWNGLTPVMFGSGCPSGGDQGLELVTVSASTGAGQLGGAFSQSLTVLKRSTP
jgi:prepilin-type N-terminal cleavage/methylation domain-containing protein